MAIMVGRVRKKILHYLKTILLFKFSVINILIILFVLSEKFIPLKTVASSGCLMSLATIIGAILVLVPTLFLLSVQKASEAWSLVIMHLYITDIKTKIFFCLSGISCIAYLIFSILDFPEPNIIEKQIVLLISLTLFAANLDFLVHYVLHVCHLLDPNSACNILIKKAKRLVDKIHNTIPYYIKEQLQGEILTKEKTAKLKREFYARLPEHQKFVSVYIKDIAEIAYKAATRNDNITAKAAVNGIGEVAIYYLEKRNDNINYYIDFLSITSDLDSFQNEIFEDLKRIYLAALKNDNEQIMVNILAIYSVVSLVNIHSSALHFFMQCVQKSLEKNLQDAAFQGTAILLELAIKLKQRPVVEDVFSKENEMRLSLQGTREKRLIGFYIDIFTNIVKILNNFSGSQLFDVIRGRANGILNITFDYFKEALQTLVDKKDKLNGIQIDSLMKCFSVILGNLMFASRITAKNSKMDFVSLNQSFKDLSDCFGKLIELAELSHNFEIPNFCNELLNHVGQEIFVEFNKKLQEERKQPPISLPLTQSMVRKNGKSIYDLDFVTANTIEQTAIIIKSLIDLLIKRLEDKQIYADKELDKLSQNFGLLSKENSKT